MKNKISNKAKSSTSNITNFDSAQSIPSKPTKPLINQTATSNSVKSNTITKKQELDTIFNSIESTLSEYVLGQNDYISKLIIAFKRPFAYGKEDGVKNTIFITGPTGSGRHLSVKAIGRFLKENKLIKKSGIHSIDLAKYKLESDSDNLFLSDLYNALYSSEQIIVFDNFEKCHQSALDLLTQLVVDEKLKLNRRYIEQLGQW
ncbi:hypothetical protein [Paraclostridium sp. AKS81]|uniref:hypothetical protein n=1 Tax=Paraclostridium sp. AKS81 TaxID=2876117 RepID=UPI0021E0140F|nr:hypothetical protein [Paraclostridium sp. AKS81]MCU9810527.1 hypothetical protein [Paraclostridium sp. AKS81]